MELSLGEIARAIGGELIKGDPWGRVRGVSTDSRTLRPGELFFALKGRRFDGHDFLPEARGKGAAGAVVEREVTEDLPLIQVPSTSRALGSLAAHWRGRLRGKVIAVTGSCGKTTTRDLISHILLRSGRRVASSPKNFNNHIGLPLSLLNASPDHEAVVLEMGMSAPGEIAYLARIARPDVGVITSVGPVHLEAFPDGVRGVQRAKAEVLEGMGEGGVLVYNGDDPLTEEIGRGFGGEGLPFGTGEGVVVKAEGVTLSPWGTTFRLKTPWGGSPVRTRLLGRGGVYCCLAAASVALALGLGIQEVVLGLEGFEPPPMRMKWRAVKGAKVLEDAYNSNPLALRNALEVLAMGEGRKVAVLGDMAELGRWSEELHREAGRWCAELGLDALFLLGEWGWAVREGAKEGGFRGPVVWARDHRELARAIREFLAPGDLVLVKGSRSMEMERVIELLEEG